MKTIAVFVALVAVALAAPQDAVPVARAQTTSPAAQVYVVKESPSNNIGVDGYQYSYELSDGQTRQESAKVETRAARDGGEPSSVLRVEGSYSWVNPEDGQTYTITYIADENGFQPQGAHIPVAV